MRLTESENQPSSWFQRLEAIVGPSKSVEIEGQWSLVEIEKLSEESRDWRITVLQKKEYGTRTEKYELKNDRGLVYAYFSWFHNVENVAGINFRDFSARLEDGADWDRDIGELDFDNLEKRQEFNQSINNVLDYVERILKVGRIVVPKG